MMQVWKIILTVLFIPLAVLYGAAKIILGKERAKKLFYRAIVSVSARVLSWHIPTLEKGQPFSVFSDHFIGAMRKMPFETIRVTIRTDDTFQINVTRCQFVEVFQLLGMPELTPALCEGDVVFCDQYQPLIRFQRPHNMAAGDRFCDHTYIRQQDSGQEPG